MRTQTLLSGLLATAVLLLSACSINPVTGERELLFISEQQEIQIGEQNYLPSRQMQGGDYVLEPELTAYVQSVGQRLALASDRRLPYDFVVLNSSVPNAWALPGGKIALNRGLLLEMQTEAELAAVLGHEIVHAAARHTAKSMSRGMLLQIGVMGTAIAASDSNFGNLIVGGANLGAQYFAQRYGRGAELEADRYGMSYMSRAGYNPLGAVELQETFVRLSEGREQDWLQGLFSSHPPSQERVDRNKETAATLSDSGEIGTDRYQSRIAALVRRKPAYDAHDEGRKALSEDRLDEALDHAQQALKAEPREGHFHALRGDIRFKQRRFDDAKINYTRAINNNAEFFYYYLQRGLVAQQLGESNAARQDLEASVRLLPTATAYNALGGLAERGGNVDGAIQYYRSAAGSQSEVGKAASTSLARLDLPRNPNQYLRLRTGLDEEGYLLIEVGNPTSVAVGNIGLLIRYADAAGQVRDIRQRVRFTLAAGQSGTAATGLGPFADTRAYRVRIESAAVAN